MLAYEEQARFSIKQVCDALVQAEETKSPLEAPKPAAQPQSCSLHPQAKTELLSEHRVCESPVDTARSGGRLVTQPGHPSDPSRPKAPSLPQVYSAPVVVMRAVCMPPQLTTAAVSGSVSNFGSLAPVRPSIPSWSHSPDPQVSAFSSSCHFYVSRLCFDRMLH